MNTENSLKIAVFLDRSPGHQKQTLGVLDALKDLTSIQTVEITVPHLPLGNEVAQWIKYIIFPTAGCSTELVNCDFMLGTGSRTHIPMLACKKKYRLPAVTCMAPAAFLRSRFDLCFVPQHDGIPAERNIFYTMGPPNRCRSKYLHDAKRGLILIGGRDEKSHNWRDTAVVEGVSTLLQREKDMTWTISSSPRTPETTISSLENLATAFENAFFVRFSDTGPGWIEKEYDRNGTVWVTADSVSMIFEALSAGCRVGIFPVQWKHKNNKFQRCVDDLARRGLLVFFPEWKEGKTSKTSAEPLNEAQRCASEILKRWWPNRLQ